MFTKGMANTKWEFPEDAKTDLSLMEFLEIARDESIPFDGARFDYSF